MRSPQLLLSTLVLVAWSLSACRTIPSIGRSKTNALQTQLALIATQKADTTPHGSQPLAIASFIKEAANKACINRQAVSHLAVVDFHYHTQSFGTEAMPFQDSLINLKKSGVLFVLMNGIGQRLFATPGVFSQDCQYYRDCPRELVLPDLSNDLTNVREYQKILSAFRDNNSTFKSLSSQPAYQQLTPHAQLQRTELEFAKYSGIHIALSMTSFDLTQAKAAVERIGTYETQYPGFFNHVGELNLVKQALFPNGHLPTSQPQIDDLAPFMAQLAARKIALSIHSDLGWDTTEGATDKSFDSSQLFAVAKGSEPEKYKPLIQRLLDRYPENKIVWLHFGGISKQLSQRSQQKHLAMLSSLLDSHPNLYLDISWTVLDELYFSRADQRQAYIDFINTYHRRILPGSDFVAAATKSYDDYARERNITNSILQNINDQAFRSIVLGQNYFDLVPGLSNFFEAPQLCTRS